MHMLMEALPQVIAYWIAVIALVVAWRGHVELRRKERELHNRITILFDRLNERDGRVRTVGSVERALVEERGVVLRAPAPLPVAKVVRR